MICNYYYFCASSILCAPCMSFWSLFIHVQICCFLSVHYVIWILILVFSHIWCFSCAVQECETWLSEEHLEGYKLEICKRGVWKRGPQPLSFCIPSLSRGINRLEREKSRAVQVCFAVSVPEKKNRFCPLGLILSFQYLVLETDWPTVSLTEIYFM